MGTSLRDALAGSLCMNLRTFRKDGTPVDTPIWVVPIGDNRFGSYTDDRSFKVKRLRRNPRVEIAACDVWGICSTPFYPAVCRFVEDPEHKQRIFAAIAEKYGMHWKMSLWGSRLVGRVKHRIVLECEPLEAAEPRDGAVVAGLRTD